MTDLEFLAIWKKAGKKDLVELHHNQLLLELKKDVQQLEKSIKKRDNTETLIALLLIPLFGVIAWFVPNMVAKTGALLVIPYAFLVLFLLRYVKKYRSTNCAMPIKEYLKQYKNYLEKEVQLLSNVAFWYLLPAYICITLLFIGMNTPLFFYVVVLIGYIWIYYYNKRAIETRFLPLIEKLNKSIRSLADQELE